MPVVSISSRNKGMNLGLQDKIIIITGGAKGIGGATTRMLADEGAIPVIIDRDVEAGESLQRELKAKNQTSLLLFFEITEAENCRQIVDQTVAAYGRIDALINNVGVNDNIGLENGSPDHYIESLKKNLFHYYNMAHYALPHLKKTKGS